MYRLYSPTDTSTELIVRKNRHTTKKTIALQHDQVTVFNNGNKTTKTITRPYSFIRPTLDIIPLKTETDEIREICSDVLNHIINNVVISHELKHQQKSRAVY
jgi:hypothetical protein